MATELVHVLRIVYQFVRSRDMRQRLLHDNNDFLHACRSDGDLARDVYRNGGKERHNGVRIEKDYSERMADNPGSSGASPIQESDNQVAHWQMHETKSQKRLLIPCNLVRYYTTVVRDLIVANLLRESTLKNLCNK